MGAVIARLLHVKTFTEKASQLRIELHSILDELRQECPNSDVCLRGSSGLVEDNSSCGIQRRNVRFSRRHLVHAGLGYVSGALKRALGDLKVVDCFWTQTTIASRRTLC